MCTFSCPIFFKDRSSLVNVSKYHSYCFILCYLLVNQYWSDQCGFWHFNCSKIICPMNQPQQENLLNGKK